MGKQLTGRESTLELLDEIAKAINRETPDTGRIRAVLGQLYVRERP
jgi:hypothetical protein